MARSRSTGPETPPAKSDVYVGLLFISLAAQIAAAVFFYLDWSSYPTAQPKPPTPEDIRLTRLLVPLKGVRGGLRDRIVEERVKRQGLLDEIESVESLGTIAQFEMAVVRERIRDLDEQIASLRRTLSRVRRLDVSK